MYPGFVRFLSIIALSLTLVGCPLPAPTPTPTENPGESESQVVPNFVGMSQAQAVSTIASAGFSQGTTTQQFSDTVPEGQVISQEPAAGLRVSPNASVRLVISSGLPPKTVPYVIGRSRADATTAITSAGLKLGTITERLSTSVPRGNVIGQHPAAGANIAADNTVSLVVSLGTPVSVPNVVGKPVSFALESLKGAGLLPGTVSVVYSETVPAAQVMSQLPVASESVARNSTVDLVASKGPEPVAVPNFVGMTRSAAESAITMAGFPLGTISVVYSDTVANGRVIEQSPLAAELVQPNVPVTLVVSKGPEPAVVPDVVGIPRVSAETTITNARLAVGTVTEEFSTEPIGMVLRQSPDAGLSFPPNTSVNLVVSKGVEMVPVPNVVGMLQATAQSTIITARLTVGTVTRQFSDTIPTGTVLSQSPAALANAPTSSPVSFVVSKGPQTSEQTQQVSATGGTLALDLATLAIPSGALETPAEITMTRNMPQNSVAIESSEIAVSEVYSLESDSVLPIQSANGVFTYTLAFDATTIGNGTPVTVSDVTLYLKVSTPNANFRLAGTVANGKLAVTMDSLPPRASIQIVYNPNMRHVFSDPLAGKTLTQNPAWQTTRFRVTYDWTDPLIQQAVSLFSGVASGSLTEIHVAAAMKLAIANNARDAALYCQSIGLRQANLRVGRSGTTDFLDLHVGTFNSTSHYVDRSTTWRQLSADTNLVVLLSLDTIPFIRSELTHELVHACFNGYDLDLGPRNQYAISLNESLSTLAGYTFALGAVTLPTTPFHLLSKTVGNVALNCTETECTFSSDGLENMDWYAYIAKRFDNGTLNYLGGNGSNGLLEHVRLANNLEIPASTNDALLLLRNAMHTSLQAQFSQPLGEIYWDYARNRAYEHNDESRLRPADSAVDRYTLQRSLFEAAHIAETTMSNDDQTLNLSAAQLAALRDIPPLSSRVLILKTSGFQADLTLNFVTNTWTPDVYGNSMMVKAYHEGADGVELPFGENSIRLTGFGEPSEVSSTGSIIVLFSNTSVDKTYSVDLSAVTTIATGGIGTLAGRVTNAQNEAAISGVEVVVRGRNFDDNNDIIGTTTTDANGQFTLADLPSGYAELSYTRSGFVSTIQTATIVPDVTSQIARTLLAPVTAESTGSASGRVIDTVTGNTISGVTLTLRSGILRIRDNTYPVVATTTTNANGQYTFSNINAGTYTAFASASGYIDDTFLVFVIGGSTSSAQDGDMSTMVGVGEIRIVLTWGESPFDLDSHLTGPSGGGRFHIYFANPQEGNADLDLDDVSSFGPETTTIHQRANGTYRFSVHDYTNLSSSTSRAMSNSSANVKVFTEFGTVEFNITPNTPGTLWTVFEIDGLTGAITERNQYSFLPPSDANTKELGWRYGLGVEVPTIVRDLPQKE